MNLDNFNWYNEKVLKPAVQWIDSPDGIAFVRKNFGYLYNDIYNNRDAALCRNYMFTRLGTPIYNGEAVKPYLRVCAHIHHLATDPKGYFGVDADEVPDLRFQLIGESIPSETLRKERELEFRQQYAPVLNPANLSDRCIPRSQRYEAVHTWYNDPNQLRWVIDSVLYKYAWAFGWNEILSKTPCADYSTLEIPYGLEQRIETYIDDLDMDELRSLLNRLAYLIAGKFYVQKKTAVKVLSRIFCSIEGKEDLKTTVTAAAMMQIKLRQEALLELTKTT